VRLALALLLLAAAASSSTAGAGGRPRYGGALRVAIASKVAGEPPGGADPLDIDRPETAALSSLWAPPLCRLDPQRGVVPTLAELSRPGPGRVSITLRGGGPKRAAELVARWNALSRPAAPSPYRALLAPIRGLGQSGGTVEVMLAHPWPDLERTLCHPALGFPDGGPYSPALPRGSFTANLSFPEGRPFPDRLQILPGDERRAARLFATRQAEVLLGMTAEEAQGVPPPAGPAAPALFATFLAYRAAHAGAELRAVLEQAIDPQDLVQHFVSAPAVPMTQLLPPALMGTSAAHAPAAGPAPHAPGRELALLYDLALEEHRAVAERIQVRLHDRGYRVALQPLPRAELGARWASGDFDLLLQSLLLPPVPPAALALAIELSGRHDLLSVELGALGALADLGARDARARERAAALRPVLPLLPLYASAAQLSASPAVQALRMDGFGLPMLDQVFLSPE